MKRGPYQRVVRVCACGAEYMATQHAMRCPLCRKERRREQQREWARRNKARVIQSRLTQSADE